MATVEISLFKTGRNEQRKQRKQKKRVELSGGRFRNVVELMLVPLGGYYGEHRILGSQAEKREECPKIVDIRAL